MDHFCESAYLYTIGSKEEPFLEPEDEFDEDFSLFEENKCRCGEICKLFVIPETFHDPAEHYWVCPKCKEEY